MLFRDRAQQRVLVVSHGGTLRVSAICSSATPDEFVARWDTEPVANCAVTSYTFYPSTPGACCPAR